MATNTPRYRFGPLDRSGLLVGLRGGQIAILALGAVVAVGLLRRMPSWTGVGVGLAIAVAACVIAFVPVAGRTIEEWIPVMVGWVGAGLTGRRRFTSSAPLAGRTMRLDPQPVFPPALKGIEILAGAAPGTSQGIGVIKDRSFGTYTAILSVKGRSFALLDPPEKSRRLTQWSSILSGFAREGTLIFRIQWLERTLPDDGDELHRYAREEMAVSQDHPAAESYLELVSEAGPVTQQHEVLLAVSIQAGRASRAIKLAGGGDIGACEVLRREVATLTARLQGADLQVQGALTPRLVAKAIRSGFDPYLMRRPNKVSANGSPNGAAASSSGPMATEVSWSYLKADDVYHATFWIAEWPRVDVDPDFLAPLLLRTDRMRTVSIVMEPVSPLRAMRQVEHQKTVQLADEELRRRAGFISSARRRREQEALSEREDELAQGHADLRFSGFVSVSAHDPQDLETACGEVEQAAGQSYLEIRRLYGEQDLAFTYTLPLARGLR